MKRMMLLLVSAVALAAVLDGWGFVADVPERKMNFDETKIRPYRLADPLTFADGRKVTKESWPARRREMLDVLAREIFGSEPPLPETVEVEVSTNVVVCAGFGVRRQYRMWFKKERSGPFVDWLVWLPNRPKDERGLNLQTGVPVVLFLNYGGNHEYAEEADVPMPASDGHRVAAKEEKRGSALRQDNGRFLPLQTILARGYAVMTANYEQIAPDNVERMCDGVLQLWPRAAPDAPRSLGAWAWALSRGLDLAERVPEIDAKKSVVTGCSRLGKTALLAGARDERFAVVVPNQTGKGGVPLWKHDCGENLSMFFRKDSCSWFLPSMRRYAADETKMPFDMHFLVASVAPRALLVEGFSSKWFDPHGELLSLRATSPVWELLTGTGLPHVPFPDLYATTAVGPRLGYVCRGGWHGIAACDWMWMLDFADRCLDIRR